MVNVTIGNSCGYGIIALNIVGMNTFEYLTIHGNNTITTFCGINDTIFRGIALLNLEKEAMQKHTTINI